MGRQTTYTYDGAGHLATVQSFDGRRTIYTYDTGASPSTAHALTEIAFADGSHRFFVYDALGHLVSTSRDANAETVTFAQGPAGIVRSTDALGNTTRVFFDHHGLAVKTEDPLGNAVHLTFDYQFNLTKITDPLAAPATTTTTRSATSSAARTRWVWRRASTYTFPLNRMSAVIDANGNKTGYSYTSTGNVEAIAYPDGTREQWGYDSRGKATAWTNRRGHALGFTYDAAGRLTGKALPDGSQASYAYDARGNLTTATTLDPALAVKTQATMTYDANDRLARITDTGGRFLAFTYDAGGRRQSSLDQLGHRLGYHYDAAGRLARVSDETGTEVVRHEYDAAGRLRTKTLGNGMVTGYAYDPRAAS